MKRAITMIVIAVTVVLLTGCITLTRSDKIMLRELQSYGIPKEDQEIKHPGVAGALNLLPGFGNFYLAAGTDEQEEWIYGFLNLLTWPVSILWGIPEAAIDANTINEKETLYYYKFDPQGKKELEAIKAQQQ